MFNGSGFTTTWDYTTLKHASEIAPYVLRFTTTWDYTTLKLTVLTSTIKTSFTTTWDYTTLKHGQSIRNNVCRFYYHLGLHYSQTAECRERPQDRFYYHLGLHYSQTSNFKTAGISFGKMGKLAVFLRFGAALRHYSRVSGGSKTIIAHESKFAKVFVDDPHLLTGSDRLFLSALQQENGQFFIKHRLIKKRYFILRKE